MTTAVKKATELKISPIGDFKKRIGGIIKLPSGLVVRYNNPGGLTAFMGSSTIPNGLMSIVNKSLKGSDNPEGEEAALIKEAEENPEFLEQMAQMLDSVAVRCIVEPFCNPIPAPGEVRADDKLYVDEIDLADKQFIFELITSGVNELNSFRK